MHTVPPNPSIERTSQGLRPCAASHVKRSPMNTADWYFGLITREVDLDDPREKDLAQKFMIDALYRVTADLPPEARDAAAVANRFATGVASADDIEKERVRLWNSIKGRDISDEINVLRIRTAIHVLYPPEALEMHDAIDSFLAFWFRGGLSESKLCSFSESLWANNQSQRIVCGTR